MRFRCCGFNRRVVALPHPHPLPQLPERILVGRLLRVPLVRPVFRLFRLVVRLALSLVAVDIGKAGFEVPLVRSPAPREVYKYAGPGTATTRLCLYQSGASPFDGWHFEKGNGQVSANRSEQV